MDTLAGYVRLDATATTAIMGSTNNRLDNTIASQPVPYRLRRDIRWELATDAEQKTWVATDPLSRRLFRCGDHEKQLLTWFDEQLSIEQLQKRFNEQFAPRSIEFQRIDSLISECRRCNLLRSTHSPSLLASRSTSPQLDQFTLSSFSFPSSSLTSTAHSSSKDNSLAPIHARNNAKSVHWVQTIANYIRMLFQSQVAIGNPDALLEHVAPRTDWLYSSAARRIWILVASVCCVLMVTRYEQLWMELPQWSQMRTPSLLVGFGLIFFLTRLAHECGHAICCKREGAACSEFGLMFAFGMACPYVDITDSWRVANRYLRMWIAAAGMYTEGIIASFAALIWLTTFPGFVHQTALHTMLVCSITTVLFNANPFMRYDGYFILCDWLGIQRLRERSANVFHAWMDRRWPIISQSAVELDLEQRTNQQFNITNAGFVSFYLLSLINRLILTAGIIATIYSLANYWRVSAIGIAIVIGYVLCAIILSVASHIASARRRSKSSPFQTFLGICTVVTLVYFGITMPIPSRVACTGAITQHQSEPIYAPVTGRITQVNPALTNISHMPSPPDTSSHVTLSQQSPEYGFVHQSDSIAILSNERLQLNRLRIQKRHIQSSQQQKAAERLAYHRPEINDHVPALAAQTALASKQLAQQLIEEAQLHIDAPFSGWFEPAKATPPEPVIDPVRQIGVASNSTESDSGDPWVSPASIGRKVERGTILGWLHRDLKWTIQCELNQEQISNIAVGTRARVRLNQYPTLILDGKVLSVAISSQTASNTATLDAASSAPISWEGTTTPMRSSDPQLPEQQLANTVYLVEVEFDVAPAIKILPRGNAEVVFITPNQSILRMTQDFFARYGRIR